MNYQELREKFFFNPDAMSTLVKIGNYMTKAPPQAPNFSYGVKAATRRSMYIFSKVHIEEISKIWYN